MRTIPDTITNPAVIEQLKDLTRRIDEKMKAVKSLKDTSQMDDLKKVSREIDQLDQEWKKLAGI